MGSRGVTDLSSSKEKKCQDKLGKLAWAKGKWSPKVNSESQV